jgi:hypothetical protein
MSPLERQIIRDETGQEIPLGIVFSENVVSACTALSRTHRCKIYAVRPLICRIWGLTEKLRCPYGCVPVGGLIPDVEMYVLLNAADQISGVSRFTEEEIREAYAQGDLQRAEEFARVLARSGVNPLRSSLRLEAS